MNGQIGLMSRLSKLTSGWNWLGDEQEFQTTLMQLYE